MTVVIKSASVGIGPNAVQTFGRASPAPVFDALSHEVRLEARIAELEAEIARRDGARPEELAEARAAGAREALEERSDAEAQAISELKRALAKAQAKWTEQLGSWEGLSIGIAHAVLEQVFADADDRSASVASAIERRLHSLEAHSVVCVRVSSADFADADRLRSAARKVGGNVEIAVDCKLKSGDCVIDFKLGHADLGLPAQWTRISNLLERLERAAANP